MLFVRRLNQNNLVLKYKITYWILDEYLHWKQKEEICEYTESYSRFIIKKHFYSKHKKLGNTIRIVVIELIKE